MKRLISKTIHYSTLFALTFFIFTQAQAQNTNIGQDKACINCPGEDPDPSAVLEVSATNKGILIPRVANTAAINNPAEGLMIYDNSVDDFKYYDGSNWQSVGLKHISFPTHANAFVGVNAGISNTTGYHNTATGYSVLNNNTEGCCNTSSGYKSLHENTIGDHNTAIGWRALQSNTTGTQNTALGSYAMASNSEGIFNTAVGRAALINNTEGSLNTAIGWQALRYNITGKDNTANGYASLYSNTTGVGNTAIGVSTLNANTIGNNNTAIGRAAFSNDSTFNNSTAIGYNAQPTGSNQVRIGNSNITQIGGYTNWSNVSDARFKKQIQEDVPGLAFISQLKPVTYQMDMDAIAKFHQTPDSLRLIQSEKRKNAIRYTGFLAQDVEKVAASIGYNFSGIDKPKHEKDNYSLRYAEFVVPLVKAVQELEKENKQIKTELSKRLENLEAQVK